MAEIKKYSTAGAFRTSLEERLRKIAQQEQSQVQKVQRQIAFDRLLARLFIDSSLQWALKGGYAMELRLNSARATKDIDLAMRDEALLSSDLPERNQKLQELLQSKANKDLGDFFIFTIKPASMDIDGAPYGGARFPIEAKMDERVFSKFSLDIGIGDVWLEPLETLEMRDWLGFAGISNQPIPAVSKEQQFAEKLHAYTLPREHNSRVKDLIDMSLLISTGKMNGPKLKKAIEATFKRRATHEVPSQLISPPSNWSTPFAALAKECRISENITEAFSGIENFLRSLK